MQFHTSIMFLNFPVIMTVDYCTLKHINRLFFVFNKKIFYANIQQF